MRFTNDFLDQYLAQRSQGSNNDYQRIRMNGGMIDGMSQAASEMKGLMNEGMQGFRNQVANAKKSASNARNQAKSQMSSSKESFRNGMNEARGQYEDMRTKMQAAAAQRGENPPMAGGMGRFSRMGQGNDQSAGQGKVQNFLTGFLENIRNGFNPGETQGASGFVQQLRNNMSGSGQGFASSSTKGQGFNRVAHAGNRQGSNQVAYAGARQNSGQGFSSGGGTKAMTLQGQNSGQRFNPAQSMTNQPAGSAYTKPTIPTMAKEGLSFSTML